MQFKRGDIVFRAHKMRSIGSGSFASSDSESWDVVKFTSVSREGKPLRLMEWRYGGWSTDRKIQPYEERTDRYLPPSHPITERNLQRMPGNKAYWPTQRGESLRPIPAPIKRGDFAFAFGRIIIDNGMV